MRPPLSECVDPLAHHDPVAAVLAAHETGTPLLLATSGTSGPSRGVVRTTTSWFESFDTVAGLTGLDRSSRVWVPGPVAGTMNLFATVLARVVGAAVVDGPEGATHAHLTPTRLRRLLGERARLGGLHLTVAGDRLDAGLYARATGAGAPVAHYYGAAELSFVAWGGHEADLRPFPGVDVRARDGVLWVRSPYLAEVSTDVDGFTTVGDLGEITLDGRVVVRGRGDTAVVTGGATVLVEPVEAVIREAAAGDVAVVGVPHTELGEVVAAVLTRADDVSSAHQLTRARLPETHRPRLWYLADQLPRTSAGKLDRAALRALVTDGGLRRLSPAVAS